MSYTSDKELPFPKTPTKYRGKTPIEWKYEIQEDRKIEVFNAIDPLVKISSLNEEFLDIHEDKVFSSKTMVFLWDGDFNWVENEFGTMTADWFSKDPNPDSE